MTGELARAPDPACGDWDCSPLTGAGPLPRWGQPPQRPVSTEWRECRVQSVPILAPPNTHYDTLALILYNTLAAPASLLPRQTIFCHIYSAIIMGNTNSQLICVRIYYTCISLTYTDFLSALAELPFNRRAISVAPQLFCLSSLRVLSIAHRVFSGMHSPDFHLNGRSHYNMLHYC